MPTLIKNKFRWVYLAGFFIILAMPLATLTPLFYPPDWGKVVVFRSVLAILVFLFIFQLLYQRRQVRLPAIKKNYALMLLAALFFVFTLATLFSVDRYFSLWGSPERAGGVINFAGYMICAALAFFVVEKQDWQKIWNFAVGIAALVSLIAVIQFYGLFNAIFITVNSRPASTLGNPDFLGIYLLLLCFITLWLAIKENRAAHKITYTAALLLFVYVILISGSRAAYLGLFLGAVYFILWYPKKFFKLKAVFVGLLVVAGLTIWLASINAPLPKFLEDSNTFQSVYSRLSVNLFLNDARFDTWKIALKALEQKPLLGWGPENFSVAFDKNYNPTLPYLDSGSSDWWDRAHSIFFDVGIQAGILGIIAYFAFFGYLFWSIQKLEAMKKKSGADTHQLLALHSVNATLLAYVGANLFIFDSFSSYLISFLIAGYAMHLLYQPDGKPESVLEKKNPKQQVGQSAIGQFAYKSRHVIIGLLFLALGIFLWQYNILPFQINAQVNIANNMAAIQDCTGAFATLANVLPEHSILDAYIRLEYVEDIKTCAQFNPQNNTAYAVQGLQLLKEAAAVQPLYTRTWIYLGSFTTVLANVEQDPATKQDLINQANADFDRAEFLSPGHQELWLERIKLDVVAENYQKMEQDAVQCIQVNADIDGQCHWEKAMAELYLGQNNAANADMSAAEHIGFNPISNIAYDDLADVYIVTQQYQKLAEVYEGLIQNSSHIPDYYSRLAATYYKLGQYEKARQEALTYLQMVPQAKDAVDAFLQTLPQ